MRLGSLVIFLLVLGLSAQADDGLPLPGAITTQPTQVENIIDIAPKPGKIGNSRGMDKATSVNGQVAISGGSGQSSPLPGSLANYPAQGPGKSSYQLLPISPAEAKTRIEELKTLLLVSRPQAIQDQIYNMCDWLTEMCEAHNKLANAFARQEETKPISAAERATANKFGQLKNEAQLLKAELLIRQNRSPEALGFLVDIVVADPKSATGRAAYQQLKELGFSEEVPIAPPASRPVQATEAVKPNAQGTKPIMVSKPGKKSGAQGAPAKTPNRTIVKVVR